MINPRQPNVVHNEEPAPSMESSFKKREEIKTAGYIPENKPAPDVKMGQTKGGPQMNNGETNNPDALLNARSTSENLQITCKPGEIVNVEIKMTNTGAVNWPIATTLCR